MTELVRDMFQTSVQKESGSTYKLFEHQQKGIEVGVKGSRAFFWSCGVGKTLVMLKIIEKFKANNNFNGALVVCPLSIIEAAWISDCRKFTPELSIVSLWDKKGIERIKKLQLKRDIYVANYNTFKFLYQQICEKQLSILIVDESSKMKSPKSQITQSLLSLAGIKFRKSKYKTVHTIPTRFVLSGTPAPNFEDEYWSQCKFITGPGNHCFNDNYYAFRSLFFYSIDLDGNRKMYKFRNSMRQEFMDSMAPVVDIVRKEDALDLPDQIHCVRKVQLRGEEAVAYREMEQTFVLKVKDEMILANNVLVEIMKLRQLSSGFVYTEDSKAHVFSKSSKIAELQDLLDEIGNHQVIIWANFKHEIETIKYMLKPDESLVNNAMNCSVLYGETKDRNEEIRNFQTGRTQYLIANPKSAAHGLTLANCKYAIYFSMDYSYESLKQSQDRIHRIGQSESPVYYYLIAEDTIDEVIFKSLTQKHDLSKLTLNYLKGKVCLH